MHTFTYGLQRTKMGRRKFRLSVLRKNYERSKHTTESLPVSIPDPLRGLQSVADELRPLTTTSASPECSSLVELRGVLKGATNAIPVGWSLVPARDDNDSEARLTMIKVSAHGQEMEAAGPKIVFSLTVHSDFAYTVRVRERLLEPSRTTLLQDLPMTISALSSMTMVLKTIDSAVICRGNSNKKYHSLRGWTKGSFLDRTGELLINFSIDSIHSMINTNLPAFMLACINSCFEHVKLHAYNVSSGVRIV